MTFDELVSEMVKQRDRANKAELEIERLEKRDCNASIELVYNDGENPFAREQLSVVDVGVSDNCYVVESKVLKDAQVKIEKLRRALELCAEQNYCTMCGRLLNDYKDTTVDNNKGKTNEHDTKRSPGSITGI